MVDKKTEYNVSNSLTNLVERAYVQISLQQIGELKS